jgi:hypothetical protein
MRLAAIVESSNGAITSGNQGAEMLFVCRPAEMIGRSA